MNTEAFTKELVRCLKAYQENRQFTYRGPEFKTNTLLATVFPIEKQIETAQINKQSERGVEVIEQFLLAAYQMGYDSATNIADQEKKTLLKLFKSEKK